jgi:hypothetical protein
MTVAQMSSTKIAAQETIIAQTKLGAASAAFVASGLGCFYIGFLTTLAEMNTVVKSALTWSAPVGPLSGKVGVGVILWVISWVILHNLWKDQDSDIGKSLTLTLVFFVLGFLLTFPPIFQGLAGG